jgi:hypothetical protein
MYDMNTLREWSGANNSSARIKYEVPNIKFNGMSGSMQSFAIGADKTAGVDIPGNQMSVVLLRARRTVSAFKKEGTKPIVMFSNEHNTWRDEITIWKKDDAGSKVLATGLFRDLRETYKELDLRFNLYILYQGAVNKIQIRGKSRRNFAEYAKKLNEAGKNIFEVNTKITAQKEKNQVSGMEFYALSFESTGDSSIEMVAPCLQEVGEKMNSIDEQFKTTQKSKPREEVQGELPIIKYDEPSDDLNVDDIPY